MRLVTVGAALLCLSACPRAQQPPPQPRAILRGAAVQAAPDSDRAPQIETVQVETVQVLQRTVPPDRMAPALRRRMIETLEAQRALWEQRRPRQYVIRVFELSGCAQIRTGPYAQGELLRDRLVVRDTLIVRHEPAPTPGAYAQRCLIEWRVDDLFRDVARILADPGASIAGLEYDAAFGFPRAYWPDRGGLDRGRGVLVESFSPAP